jgi:hypothetical protein
MFKIIRKNDINHKKIDIDIDIVISWIDSSDLNIKNKIEDNYKNIKNYSLENLRFGNRDTLKYVLRGIHKNIPWVRKIYIVTKSQWPNWLDEKIANNMNPPIIRIDEKDIHPEGRECNGSIAVEACLYRIPNLSDFFLYANDDMFICKPMLKNEWMFTNNIGYTYNGISMENKKNKTGWFNRDTAQIDQVRLFNEIYPDNNFNFFYSCHHIRLLNKKCYQIIEKKLPEILKHTQNVIGRINNDTIICHLLLEYIGLHENLFKTRASYDRLTCTNFVDFKNKYSNKITLLCTNWNCWLPKDNIDEYYKIMNCIFTNKLKCEI